MQVKAVFYGDIGSIRKTTIWDIERDWHCCKEGLILEVVEKLLENKKKKISTKSSSFILVKYFRWKISNW